MNTKPSWIPSGKKVPLALGTNNIWTLAITDQVPVEVVGVLTWHWKPRHTKTPEELKQEMIHNLESLERKLWPAIERYKELFWEEFVHIRDILESIRSWWFESLIKPTPRNIKILSLFSFDIVYDKKTQLEFFGFLLKKLKNLEYNIETQAHVLGFMELLRTYILNKRFNFPKDKETWDISIVDKFELQKLYEQMLLNIIDLLTNSEHIVERTKNVSIKIYKELQSGEMDWEWVYNILMQVFSKPVFRTPRLFSIWD